MQELRERILNEGRNLGKGILKVDSFLNHQIDPQLMIHLGQELARRLAHTQPTKVLTAETSGIAPALAAAAALGVPLVFARKRPPLTMDYTIVSEAARSRTQGKVIELMVSTEYLRPGDRVLIIDDFLATAQTITALARLADKVGARVVGIGTVIEKVFENGRVNAQHLNVPIESLAVITSMDDGKIVVAE
ncbi:MAG: xanthine phosphoribosyltransferase [Anaerolineales bacterium]|nr:xanthine phosphoribosyltransferase [Anaerolineales bacterium]